MEDHQLETIEARRLLPLVMTEYQTNRGRYSYLQRYILHRHSDKCNVYRCQKTREQFKRIGR